MKCFSIRRGGIRRSHLVEVGARTSMEQKTGLLPQERGRKREESEKKTLIKKKHRNDTKSTEYAANLG